MVPTRRLILLFALGIPIAGLGYAVGQPLTGIVYDLLLAIVSVATFYLAASTDAIRFRRKHDTVLSVRAANKITIEIENDGVQTISGRLRDEPPQFFEASRREFDVRLIPGRLTELTYQLTPTERGDDSFRGSYLRLDCPLGLVSRDVLLPTEEPVRVYPNILALREFDLLKQQGRLKEIGIRRSRARGLGTEFESLRDYAEGDDFRKIDWKASGRRGHLVVRQFEQERNQALVLCIDIGRHMLAEVDGVTKLDHVLDSLLMMAHAAALAGDLVGLLVYSDTVKRYIPPRKGRNQIGIIIEAIHDLLPEAVESDPVFAFGYLSQRWKRRSLIVEFTDFTDEREARALADALRPMSRRHLTAVVRVQDPNLNEVFELKVTDTPSMYRRSAAAILLADLAAARGTITASGIQWLESEPDDLAAALVNFYLMVKERSLL